MKSARAVATLINLLVGFASVSSRPQNSFTANSFSSFDPTSQTFTAGSSTNLHQESFTNNAEDFLLSFEQLFPKTNPDEAFNIFSSNGECDEFCQSIQALDAQSRIRFEQDLSDFQAQFGTSLPAAPTFTGSGTRNQAPKRDPPRIQTQSSSFPTQKDNALKTDESFKSNNNKNKENKNFLFFGNNKNNNQPQSQPPNRGRNPPPPPPTTRRPQPPTSAFTVFTTKRPTESPSTRASTAAPRTTTAVSEPVNTTTKKSTKIKWTFNGKTIGTSTIPQNSQGKSESGDNETIPISTYFNEIEGDVTGEEKTEADREEKSQNFPVFDAVPF